MMKKAAKTVLVIIFFISVMILGFYVIRQYLNNDTVKPVIQTDGDVIEVSITDEDDKLLEGITAEDNVDGDITKKVFIEKVKKKEQSEENVFEITYAVFDNSNNIGKISRDLVYIDYYAPRFTINQPLRFSLTEEIDLASVITVEDCIDGDLSSFIKIQGDDIFRADIQAGIYTCEFGITNSLGDTASITANIQIYEDNYEERNYRPTIYLKQYVIYLGAGEAFEPLQYLDYVEDRGVIQIDYGMMVEVDGEMITEAVAAGNPGSWINASEISYESNVNMEEPGQYLVTFSYMSNITNYSCSTEMIVIVGG
ncbi:MAG: hypothetical protein ACRC3H_11995 [Lachnospiraceae bacterium]